ncbi:uroporphyrin-III C-methyltransferase/precorrin-2 dehydrogenase/sirohydrochlorin ferrochelatase [Sulfitobacter undariae]|uniref:Uroporphyrin-III C-methyltransferase/precorrin-2 dehydrogenase/sirohydrochlorin ferrochelatase n=1 Tax=Sulfitobacter undariae TaxID=1563671 RepID=A0A7W6E4L1_9RHOB|nr:siroheme synthase CysG [Sulfitobacter undariae]MBB3994627.1 uroporphyrin-III C-methyltransferase/precorrin-2 dehydrogenase/sirohydrochlorin ferrochelatase [Sulfitobacter undariae]
MDHFPIFLSTRNARIIVSGGGDAAMAKLRLLMKTRGKIIVYAADATPEIKQWHTAGQLTLITRTMEAKDVVDATLFYGANEEAVEDARTAKLAKDAGALVNIVDNLADSQFITPAIVDRDPVTIAIGTEGAAPVLARAIKADLEERLPQSLGTLARIGKTFRAAADALPFGRARRDFWRSYYFNDGPKAISGGQEHVRPALNALLDQHLTKTARAGHVAFVGGGPGDPELLTLKARRALDEADVVIYDRLITPEILELARREATMIDVGKEGFGPSTSQEYINDLLVEHAQTGAQVVRLKSGDATIFGRLDEEIDAVDAHGIGWHIVPGITSASAAVATIGQSFTKRGRNASVRFLTGHDTRGFADHDWRTLARTGEVAAIYMGKKSARFIQGRLLMHGADRNTPVTLIENASRTNQRVLETTLDALPAALEAANMSGPALTFVGLAPRAALAVTPTLKLEEFA